MIQFIIDKINDQELPDEIQKLHNNLSIIDLGTGNGHLLFQMYEEFQQELEIDIDYNFLGVDYSPDSVEFAKKICSRKYNDDEKFGFSQVDILKNPNEFLSNYHEHFDILLDKGTLDAIALNQDKLADFNNEKIGMEVYASQVSQIMHSGSILLITSCNFTQDELIAIITGNSNLEVWDQIKYPSFEFGGKKGSTICSIAFIKK